MRLLAVVSLLLSGCSTPELPKGIWHAGTCLVQDGDSAEPERAPVDLLLEVFGDGSAFLASWEPESVGADIEKRLSRASVGIFSAEPNSVVLNNILRGRPKDYNHHPWTGTWRQPTRDRLEVEVDKTFVFQFRRASHGKYGWISSWWSVIDDASQCPVCTAATPSQPGTGGVP